MNHKKTARKTGFKKKLPVFMLLLLLTAVLWAGQTPAKDTKALSLNKSKITLIRGNTYKLKASGGPAGKKIKWKSTNPSVAKVNGSGKITARNSGTAVITVSRGKKKDTCRVKVIAASLNTKKVTLSPYDICSLKVKNTSQKVTWSSSNPGVASVNKNGKVTAQKAGKATITAKIGQSTLKCAVTVKADRWSRLLTKYQKQESVRQLVFVKYTGGSRAQVLLYQKKNGSWKRLLSCTGYVGYNGIGKKKEGDGKTPTGTFNLTASFGIKSNPGAKTDYVKVNSSLYWCGDSRYYNQLVDIRKHPHSCSGEHLIDYVPHYNYGMFTDYNKNNVYGKGSAIFLHCTGSNPYTAGCIAVSQKNMLKIIRAAQPEAKICIYKK